MIARHPVATPLKWLSALLFVAACKESVSSHPLQIGAVLPLTGSAAVWGQNAQRGMELALVQLNRARPAGRQINVIYEDSRSDPNAAVSALQKLIATDDVQVVIGDIASSSVLAMAPIAEAHKVVLLSPGASNSQISQAGDYIFRNWQSDALEGSVDAEYAHEKRHWKRVATLYVDNAYGTGLNSEFKKAFERLGGSVVQSESFAQGAVDLRAQITRLRQAHFDGLYLPGYPPEMATALKQMRELGLATPILSVQAFDDPEILRRAKSAAEGVTFSVPKPPSDADSVVAHFRREYKSRFKTDPGVCSDTGFDALRIIAWALDQGATGGEAIKNALYRLKDYPGAAGSTTFDSFGDVSRPFVFKAISQGSPHVITD